MSKTSPELAGLERHRQEIVAWRRWREERLREPDGWLTLAGLFWLEQGENAFGTGEENRVQLPEGSGPTRMGRFVRTGDEVRVEVEPGIPVLHDGAVVAEMALSSDTAGEPTVLSLGSLSLHLIGRGGRVAVRVRDRESRTLTRFAGLNWYPFDPTWRREGRFQPFSAPQTIQVPNFIGDPFDRESPGYVTFDVDGDTQRPDAFTNREGGLFIVFGDSTNGRDTYGGGRFLYAEPPAAGGRLNLDFNKAYNPPCVFTPYAACPLPPTQNRLSVAIEAGEKMYLGETG